MPDFYRLDADAALAELKADAKTGLSAADAEKRLAEHGANTLPRGETANLLQLVISQFKNILVIILIIAAVISLFLGDVKDVVVILAIVIANAALGTYQEYQAEQALEALSAMQVPQVRVRRDGAVHQVSAESSSPATLCCSTRGRVPADGRLILSANLQIEEAALTGESQAVYKNIGDD
ncbi:MAG: cation-transporting P-type ATPase [Anaerolineae bacterium]